MLEHGLPSVFQHLECALLGNNINCLLPNKKICIYELGFDVVVSDSPDFRLFEWLDTQVCSGRLLVESFASYSIIYGTFHLNLTSGSLLPPSTSVYYSSSNKCLSSRSPCLWTWIHHEYPMNLCTVSCTYFSYLAQTTIFALGRSIFSFIWSLLNWAHMFECYIAKLALKTGHHNDMLQVSLKPLRNSWFGRGFLPTFDILYAGVFKWCYDPPS